MEEVIADFKWSYQGVNFAGKTWSPKISDQVVVIVHGIGEHVGRYAHVANFLNSNGYAVTGIDLYGHGLSDGPRGGSKGIEFAFDYLSAFLNHVRITYQKPVVLYGHSMGGGLVTGLVLKRRPAINGVIISSPALLIPGITRISKLIFGILNTFLANFRVSKGLDMNKLTHSREVIDAFKKDKLNHDRMSIRLAYEMIKNGQWCVENAGQLSIPALLMHGSDDAFTSVTGSRIFAKQAPKHLITFKEWPGGYHELHNEPIKK
ncbi:MAG TPA: lysophospholipase [Mucilaginibacter sp.]|nr:lysophospholipase [Mucilaginibacter sp.]